MSVQKIIAKVESVSVPAVKKVALAYSGGLDSSLAVELLRRVYKAKKIVPITIDVGQGRDEIDEGNRKAKILGVKPILIDAKKEFSDEWLTRAIRANSDYNGYPVSTSMTRQLVARIIALRARALGCDAVLEGSTGKGNDQYRMHNVFKMFAPELDVLVPVRDFDLQRSEEEKLCKAWGVPVTEMITGGDDKTMWCRSIASGAIDLNQKLPDRIWMWLVPPEKARTRGETVTVDFEQGLPVKLNGRRVKLDTMIERLNVIAGRNGVGKIDMFEDGIMGLKSREIYEAPAAHVILKLHRDLEAQCLTKEEIHFKKIVEDRWATMVYHGEWYHPLRTALDVFIEATQRPVNGRFKVKFYKGNIDIVERQSETSLFSREIRSLKATAFDQRQCKDAAKIRGLIFEILARRDEKL